MEVVIRLYDTSQIFLIYSGQRKWKVVYSIINELFNYSEWIERTLLNMISKISKGIEFSKLPIFTPSFELFEFTRYSMSFNDSTKR